MPRAAIATVAAALLSLLLFVSVPGQGLWHQVTLDASHGPIFAVVAVLMLLAQPPERRAGSVAGVQAFFVAVGLGVLVEVLQTLASRPGSPFDVMTDAAGAAAGLGLWQLLQRRPGRPTAQPVGGPSAWPLAIALAGIAFIAWPPLQAARAYAHRASQFPTLAEFRAARDLTFVTTDGLGASIVELPRPWAREDGERALRIGLDARHAPAVQLIEPRPDWRGYAVLAADLTNAGDQAVRLTLRIHDRTHDWSHEDRLNLPLMLAPRTRATVRVALSEVAAAPASRSMDLAQIANVMLFGPPAAAPGEFYLSRIWLE